MECNFSEYFTMCNRVKQSGVISPVIFCIYIDGLLIELENSHVGCLMGSVFADTFGYADDLKLLTPTISAMSKMVTIWDSMPQDIM